jgi:hypothetical protein
VLFQLGEEGGADPIVELNVPVRGTKGIRQVQLLEDIVGCDNRQANTGFQGGIGTILLPGPEGDLVFFRIESPDLGHAKPAPGHHCSAGRVCHFHLDGEGRVEVITGVNLPVDGGTWASSGWVRGDEPGVWQLSPP